MFLILRPRPTNRHSFFPWYNQSFMKMQIYADQANFQLLLYCSQFHDTQILQHMINLEPIPHEFFYFLDRENSGIRQHFKALWIVLIFYLLQLSCSPVAVVMLHVYKTRNWLQINLCREGYMRSMQWQLRFFGTNSAFAFRHRNQEKPVSSWPVAGHSEY